jgi:hypothetical protein
VLLIPHLRFVPQKRIMRMSIKQGSTIMNVTRKQFSETVTKIQGGRIGHVWSEGGSILVSLYDAAGTQIAVAEVTQDELAFQLETAGSAV